MGHFPQDADEADVISQRLTPQNPDVELEGVLHPRVPFSPQLYSI